MLDNSVYNAKIPTVSLKPPLTGQPLIEWINNPEPMRSPIAEGFLYEKSCLIISADAGLGKSVLSLQAALELSCGMNLFRRLEVTRPYKCYYVIKERPKEELGERIQLMQKVIKWDADNLILDDELQVFSLARESNFKMIHDRIASFKPEVIFIDPIYAGTPGLSKDEVAGSFANFLTELEKQTGATVWLNHHVVKPTHDREGGLIQKDDPMYGSAWIKAHVTGSYLMTRTQAGVVLYKKKDTHFSLLDTIDLEFDIETYISTSKGQGGSGHDRVILFLNTVKKENRRFTMEEIMARTDLSRPSILRLFNTYFSDKITNISEPGSRGVYEAK